MTRAVARRPAGGAQHEPSLAEQEPDNHLYYEEYVRGFDDIPVLEDAVRIPARPPTPPSFVHGERRSLRKHERSDGYFLRETRASELALQYQEYIAPAAAAPLRKKRRKRKKRGRNR
jgi:hypothetical protein